MTARGLYEGVLIELNKENAPNILLEDFNYFANKAINLYINKRYNIYDINQQTTDDLRVLKATAMLPVTKINDYAGLTLAGGGSNLATYEVIMPQDYLHILNCICIYDVVKTYKCYNAGDTWRSPATRLTADAYSLVLDNFWNKPTYKRPYYYIHNVNYPSNAVYQPTDPIRRAWPTVPEDEYETVIKSDGTSNRRKTVEYSRPLEKNDVTGYFKYTITKYTFANNDDTAGTAGTPSIVDGYKPKIGTDINQIDTEHNDVGYGADGRGIQIISGKELRNSILINGVPNTPTNDNAYTDGTEVKQDDVAAYSNVERGQGIRYGNVSQVRLEIRYGSDNSVFALKKVYIDYIKAPQNIRLTQEEVDYTEDRSQMLEFPDYVCQEIINELVHLIMENITDLRLQTHPVVSLSIANPAQGLTEPVAQLG